MISFDLFYKQPRENHGKLLHISVKPVVGAGVAVIFCGVLVAPCSRLQPKVLCCSCQLLCYQYIEPLVVLFDITVLLIF